MVTRFSSISTRKLSKALTVLTFDKNMVAMNDYGAFHKMVKWYILTSVLGAIAQKRNHSHRDTMIENTLSQLHAEVKHNPLEAVNLREIFKAELFRLALRQEHGNESPADGCSQGCSYEGPGRGTEEKNCFKRGGHFTAEWAMYELGKNPKCQDHLYREIQEICENQKVTEEHLPQLPYLTAVFHETLRRHSPVPVIPLRYAHEDTQLGGYNIPSGSEIAINIYACNMDRKEWPEPEKWKPDRFLEGKKDMDLFKTMAFRGRKRVCAGAFQAMLISCTSIGRLVQEFQWRLDEGEEENVDTVQLTTHKLHPMKAIIATREN